MSELQKLLKSIALPVGLALILGFAVVILAAILRAVVKGADADWVDPNFIQGVVNLFPPLIGMFSLLALAGLVMRAFADAKRSLQLRELEPWIILILAATALSQGGFGPALALAAVIVARMVVEKRSVGEHTGPEAPDAPAKSGE